MSRLLPTFQLFTIPHPSIPAVIGCSPVALVLVGRLLTFLSSSLHTTSSFSPFGFPNISVTSRSLLSPHLASILVYSCFYVCVTVTLGHWHWLQTIVIIVTNHSTFAQLSLPVFVQVCDRQITDICFYQFQH